MILPFFGFQSFLVKLYSVNGDKNRKIIDLMKSYDKSDIRFELSESENPQITCKLLNLSGKVEKNFQGGINCTSTEICNAVYRLCIFYGGSHKHKILQCVHSRDTACGTANGKNDSEIVFR